MLYVFQKTIIPDKLQQEIINEGLDTVQYIETVGDTVNIFFSNELTSQNFDLLTNLVAAHTTSPSASDIVEVKIKEATIFGESILKEFTIENVLLGITQAGKTRQVSDYCHKLSHYISTGSLYAAMEQVDYMISQGLDPTLDPFVTEARLLAYKQKIANFLQT